MSTELTQFGERLAQALKRIAPESCNGYLHGSHVIRAVEEATHPAGPPSQSYPRMVFRNGLTSVYRVVENEAEEAQAEREGYGRGTRAAPEGYPRFFVESSHRGGASYRSVTLRSPAEWTKFVSVTEAGDWVEDPSHQWGGHGIGLSTLIEERKDALKVLIDKDQLELVAEEAPAEAPVEEPIVVEQPVEAPAAHEETDEPHVETGESHAEIEAPPSPSWKSLWRR